MEGYVLSPSVLVGFKCGVLCIGYGTHQFHVKKKEDQVNILKLLDFYRTPKTKKEAKQFLTSLVNCSEKREELINFLYQNHCVIPGGLYDPNNRYSRNHSYYQLIGKSSDEIQKKLNSATVTLLGCGGIGNCISYSLSASGVGRLILVDGDRIDETNLNRQFLFEERDIGKFKTTVIKKNLLLRNKNTEIKVYNEYMNKHTLENLPSSDLFILSADSKGILEIVNQVCIARGIPLLPVGYIQDVAIWGPLIIPGKTSCASCLNLEDDRPKDSDISQILSRINNNYQSPSTPFVNMLASSFATLDIINFLTGLSDIHSLNKRVGISITSMDMFDIPCKKNMNCSVCGKTVLT
jgi:molybdopterin-synthase adenylyltransferase